MNLGELKRLALFQTNNDEEELEELGPYLTEYLNEGYRRLWQAFGRGGGFEPLRHDRSRPEVPEWTHHAIADWAAWLMYRNGSGQKQGRGLLFQRAFEDVIARVRAMTEAEKKEAEASPEEGRRFRHIPG